LAPGRRGGAILQRRCEVQLLGCWPLPVSLPGAGPRSATVGAPQTER
jgi:hypothetical protein